MSFEQIDLEKAKELIEQGNVTIVDVRNEESYEESHIKGAHLVAQDSIDAFISKSDKEKPLICYCYHGFSSQSVANYFVENGFKEVYSLEGGFEAWRIEQPTSSDG